MADVKLVNISKIYKNHKVIDNLNVTVQDGECFTFLGPSGCGKTIILRLIAGFEQPTAGEISIGERLVASPARNVAVPPEARKIGVVFQDYAVWPHKTVFENVIYPLTIQKLAKAEAGERTMRAVKQVGLDSLENRWPYQLSGGQQQRVALARALVSAPEIMLLDEPLSNLDANLREEMRFEIKELQRKTGVTILYVTHDQEVALAISDRLAILDKDGYIRQVGTPEEIFEHSADEFVFTFMGIANLLPMALKGGRAHLGGRELLPEIAPPKDKAGQGELVAGCRPMDIELTRDEGHLAGLVKRVALLGPIIDYRVAVGETEIRVQQDTQEALRDRLVFAEGETCHLCFHDLKWFGGEPGQ